jgi:hypothetical protein
MTNPSNTTNPSAADASELACERLSPHKAAA